MEKMATPARKRALSEALRRNLMRRKAASITSEQTSPTISLPSAPPSESQRGVKQRA